MKAAFIINARNKAKYVARAVLGAFSQSYPCHILLSDQDSTDGTYEEMAKAMAGTTMPMERVAEPPALDIVLDREVKEVPRHKAELLRCPIKGKYGMVAANAHTMWLAEQTDAEWIFQCSADDYSLPDRVRVCMEAVQKHECAAIATTMYFVEPGGEDKVGPMTPRSGYPTESGYVSAGTGLWKMAYGSTIQGWRRDFLLKVGSAGHVTGDVYHGFLAALDKGYYVVASPQHVHVQHSDLENMGFQGKMRAAAATGDHELMTRINELNRFQLFGLYLNIKLRQQQLYPLAHQEDQNALIRMLLEQSAGWFQEREKLHANGWTPGLL